MRFFACSWFRRKTGETMKLIVTLFIGMIMGFFLRGSLSIFSSFEPSLCSCIDVKDSNFSTPTVSVNRSSVTQPVSDNRSFIQDNSSRSSPAHTSTDTSKPSLCSCIDVKDSNFSTPTVSVNRSSVTQPVSDNRSFIQDNSSRSSPAHTSTDTSKIWVPSNPRGAERLPPGIVEAQSDLYLRRLWGNPDEDLTNKPKYLVAFTVGYKQRMNVDACVKRFSENFTIVLFHYDDRVTEWNEFEWSKRAIHVSVHKQTKWWYAKRFLHPDIVAAYDYIFIWDEDLGVEHFHSEEYVRLVKKHGLEISQPALDHRQIFWAMTKRIEGLEIHKEAGEKPDWCRPYNPPCAAFVEIMAPVFTRNAWRCIWHMLQNDLVHGWGLDFALGKCVESPAHEKIGVVDAEYVLHQSFPTLTNQGVAQHGKAPWEGVIARCKHEMKLFSNRMENAEKLYFKSVASRGNSTSSF